MEKLFLFIAILTQLSFGQSASTMLLLMDDGGYKNAETKVYLASLTTPISPTYAATLDSFITKVKDSLSITALSSKFDVMYDLGGETSEQSLRNLVKRSLDATAVNSPTFTQWEGFAGNGTTSYVNSNFTPSTQGVAYTLNSASYGIYSLTNTTGDIVDIGARTSLDNLASFLQTRNTAPKTDYIIFSINQGAPKPYVASNDNSQGFYVVSRGASDAIAVYKNYNEKTTTAFNASTGLTAFSFYIGALNQSNTPIAFTTRRYSFAFVGGGLTAPEVSKLTNCVEWLQDRKGKGVIP